ncbi:phosphatidylinositol kinase- protein kinase tor1 [Podila verticillata]|nr:phosphatidylinositol kinase- protein kinase tor1 [Podila verticillata]
MTMATLSPVTLSRLTADLKASLHNDKARVLATEALKSYVTLSSRELSGPDLTKFYGEVNGIIRAFVLSVDNDDKLCGALIIDNLIGIEYENNTQETRFANYLRQLFPSDVPIMTVAARALGKLAQKGGAYTADLVEFEMKRAIEWLAGDQQEARKHASVLILGELVQHASVIVYPYFNSILENIWPTFREHRQSLREAAADALSALLVVIEGRHSSQRDEWYARINEEAQRGMRVVNTDSIHGSLLIFRELILHAGMFMETGFLDVCNTVLKFKDFKDGLVRRTVINLIPELAKYNPTDFIHYYLHRAMVHLLGLVQIDRERPTATKEMERSLAFLAIGKVALVVKHDMEFFLDDIMFAIKDSLRAKSKNRTATDTPIFNCISMLAQAIGLGITRHMSELLDLMLATGLSEPMYRLLNIISIELSGRPFRALGEPPSKQGSHMRRESQLHGTRNVETIILALNILGSFSFAGHALSEFVRDSCLRYLEDENTGVRRAAAQTCTKLFSEDSILNQTSQHADQIVSDVLERLLLVGIADPDSSIRHTVLSALDDRFDRHLSRARNVRTLFIALNDEIFTIRELAITIIGRIASLNPAYVVPSLRKLLIQLLTEIEYSGLGRNKEESARILTLLVVASEHLVKPYIETIMKVLLPNIRDSSPGVVSSVLETLGEIATVGGEDLLPYMDQLMPMFIDILQDQSSPTKRSAALKTLGRLARNTGYVIDPYIKYPVLLDILMSIIKTEQSVRIREETMKLLGVLGALDPYRHKQMTVGSGDQNQAEKSDNTDVALLMAGVDPSSDEYYPTVVITALLKILKDQSLSQQYQPATQAILIIFQALQLKMIPFLPQIMPVYLNIMQSGTVHNLDFYFEKMGVLVSIVKLHIRPYIPDLMHLIREHWGHTLLQERIIGLIESIAFSLDGEFKAYMPKLLRSMLAVLESDMSERHGASLRVLQALVRLGPNIEEYMHLIVPVLVKIFDRTDAPTNLRRAAISTVGALSRRINLSDYASRIILPLVRILSLPGTELRPVTMDVLSLMALQLGQDFTNFVPLISKVVIKEKIHHANYNMVMTKLLNREQLPSLSDLVGMSDDRYVVTSDVPQAESDNRKLPVKPVNLRRAWNTDSRSTKDDWADWIRRLTLEMLKETPSHSLRACGELANSFQPLARELFNAAFMSCWTSLTEQFQNEFAAALKLAIVESNSPEIVQTILNVAEYMEHDDKPLPIEIRTLGKYAFTCHAYAKALHYRELEFMTDHSTSNIEHLITINNNLQQPDGADGILTYAQLHHDIELKESWYERLQRWEDALAAYDKKQLEQPDNLEWTVKRMKCLHNLGEWEALSTLAQSKWTLAPAKVRSKMAKFAAAASWGLGQWDVLSDYISMMEHSPNKAFFKAVLYLHRDQYQLAEEAIGDTRSMLDTELTALVSESYSRAYETVVRVQMVAELEEIISYKKYEQQPDRQATLRKTWMKRLIGCERNVEIWQRMIKVHAMALTPAEDMDMRIKYMNLCRKTGRLRLAEQEMATLMGPETTNMSYTDLIKVTPPQIVYAKLKYMWATGERKQSLVCLQQFADRLAADLGLGGADVYGPAATGLSLAKGHDADFSRLLARCFLKQGEWQFALQNGWRDDSVEHILVLYQYAAHLGKDWYKAWHTWALANFDVISHFEMNPSTNASGSGDLIQRYVIPSVEGFFKSIALSAGNSLQDTLRLLTLWFKYGHRSDVSEILAKGFGTVSIDTWLQVIPQLIARIHAPSQNVHRLIHQLLADLGKAHPQALVYSLTVASKSPSVFRKKAALAIMDKMRMHSPVLVDHALLVSQELIRVAILWHEMWEEGLDEARTNYFSGGRNIDDMLAQLEPLHQMIQKPPETHHEVSFNKAFGRDLKDAHDSCIRYRKTRDVNELNHAWNIYTQILIRIKKLPKLSTLDLPYVSPQLQGVRDLELAIPGTYKSGEPIVKIQSFYQTLTVLTSKQKPRRLVIKGSDGRDYEFLLKGHEDLRQDERVMQLFGLVNTLLADDPETFKRHLSILQYSVTPLSPNSGLIGWVQDTDTLHNLIRDYRQSRDLPFDIEHRLLMEMAPTTTPAPERGYDLLTVFQKVEVFESMLEQTAGDDLYKILWLKSRNSEMWFERRTNYTRSLAVMSMVGHILGLGDRHPSNIMMERNTGMIVHIDFGDCFEVAMHRPQFPERIPFRLTRMLVKAMEVSGFEGSFRNTSENAMRVLRENKESVMAVLEAFVYDPLINWRILNTQQQPPAEQAPARNGGAVVNGGATNGAANGGTVKALVAESFPKDQARSLRRPLPSEQELVNETVDDMQPEQLNQRAVTVLNRITNKLTGRDFNPDQTLDVHSQVEKLIRQATSTENLCQCWVGYCAFW